MDAEDMYNDLMQYIGIDLNDEADDLLARFCEAATKKADEDDRGPNAKYQMFTRDGNNAAAAMVAELAQEMRSGAVSRRGLPIRVKLKLEIVAVKYPEIYDTEPQGQIAHELSKVCEELMWHEIERWDW